MSFVSDLPGRQLRKPADLTAGQKKALAIVRDYRLTRVKSGWQAPGSPKVTLPTAQYLQYLRLAMRRDYYGRPRLEITATGRQLLEMIEDRRRG